MAGAITSGMDIAQVRALVAEMTRAADQLQQISSRVTAKLRATPWEGQDRRMFESEWESRHRQQLTQVMTAFQEAARTVTRNVGEQEQASAAR